MDEMTQLAQLWKLPTGAFLQGMGAMENVRAADEEALKQQQLKTMFTQQNDPMKLREQGLQNDTLEAQLPGVVANSSFYQDRAKKSRATVDTEIADFIQASKDKIGPAQLKKLTDASEAYGRAGGAMSAIPPAARHAYARQMMGEFYNPALFDQVPPEQLPKMLTGMAEQSQMFSSKVQAKLAEISTKAQYAQQLQAQKDAAASARAEVARQLKAVTEANKQKKDPTTFEAAAVWAQKQAMMETDPDKRQQLLEFAQEQIRLKDELAKNAATARATGALDMGAATGQPTRQSGPTPQLNLTPAPATADRANRQAAPVKYTSDAEVKEAYKANKISKEEAAKLLREQFGYK